VHIIPFIQNDPLLQDNDVQPVLILGLGNLLMQDEGIGVRVIQQLQRDYQFPKPVELLDGGTAGMALYEHIVGRDHVIVIDAVRTGRPAGTVVLLKNDEVPAFFRTKLSPHQMALSDILAALTIGGEQVPELVVIGIEPETLETGLEISELVSSKQDILVERVLDYSRDLGFGALPRSSFDQCNGGRPRYTIMELKMDEIVDRLELRFKQLGAERIYGLPIYNEALTVEAVDFQICAGDLGDDLIGVLVTPWFVNIMQLPSDSDPWRSYTVGERTTYPLDSGAREFVIGEDEEVGRYLFRTVASPTQCFKDQIAAITGGRNALKALLVAPEEAHSEMPPASQAVALSGTPKEGGHDRGRRNFLRGLVSS